MAKKIDSEQYRHDCVNIDDVALNDEFKRHAADLAFWNGRLAGAWRSLQMAKLKERTVRASVELEVRELLSIEKGKSTEAMVMASADLREDWQAVKIAAIEAEAEYKDLDGFVEAVRDKKDMLVSYGANVRAELQGDPVIREQARSARLGK